MKIVSIFGQIEGVVADAMAAEGICPRIPTEQIPPTVRWDDRGRLAHCALVFNRQTEAQFDQRVRELRL